LDDRQQTIGLCYFYTLLEYKLRTLYIAHNNKNAGIYTEWPKKVSHYQKSSLNRITNRQCGNISHQFWV